MRGPQRPKAPPGPMEFYGKLLKGLNELIDAAEAEGCMRPRLCFECLKLC